ncbi:TonB-dependent receptor [Formosa sp. Hel3_A1_48]|jgi:iron complex outermembrane receptor protein|uniref:TonB-dependent receptor n=1 Tax=Winogradskyella vincentii TaxID=2877122 RepID=A0ABS7XWA1_9FLAO|nr:MULTISPECIES: TonB-dependent receptor [Flavobacteriaceae]MBT5233487.1 TonB-dependent receptor [Flavobacteriaceae bacterium]MDB4401884.1 TonB-dependent receptor [Algibacter sp.]MDC1519894.1 TonB-dependent receptor [Polaribacter sp.]MDC3249534.1 TonB-dependent receptor [bacterium]AOR25619.1 TonB-dependent receptor [Formosa sp. Hel3_A1_48]
MNKYILSIKLILILCLSLQAQTSDIQIKVLTEAENEPLMGATVYFEALEKGAVTNFDGIAEFTEIPDGQHQIIISFLGFETFETTIQIPSNNELMFKLKEGGNQLDAVVLQSTRSTRTVRKIPTRIEFIGAEELGEKAIMNPTNISMVLRESTGIQMQQTSLSSGSTNIRIQGLDGRYTQLLRDGFPLYGGFSSGLSILQIPPLDLQQFEIIKGSSSTLYGGGAIAGLVNMVSKTPDEEPALDIMLTQTQALGSTANVFYSKRNEKFGVSLYGSGHYQKAYDPEDDGFSNLPKTTSISFNPKLFYYPSDKTTLWFGLNGTYDDRIGGDITKIENGEDGIHQYTEENNSKRLSSQLVYQTQLDSISSLEFKNSVSFFDRNLTVPDFNFDGKQTNTFTEITYNTASEKTDWIVGANLYTSNFDENDNAPLQRDQKDVTFGAFANNIFDISDNWILETGLRADYNTDFGFFPLPRISLLYKNNSGFSSRIGGGLGYKIPDIFTEEAEYINFENVLAINKSTVDAERSYGVNFDLNYQTRLSDEIGFSINQLFYVTAINDGLLLNSTDNGLFQFENATDEIFSKGAETNIKFTYKDFRWFLNYALIDTKLNYLPGNPQKPLTAKHNAGSVLMYESEKWRIGYETFYTGKQFLSNGTETTDFVTMGLLVMRNFKLGSVFVNFENFTDRRQSRFSPLVLPPHENPVFPEIYAPTDGFIFSVGLIIKPFGNEHHD